VIDTNRNIIRVLIVTKQMNRVGGRTYHASRHPTTGAGMFRSSPDYSKTADAGDAPRERYPISAALAIAHLSVYY
jgi:hypothetical protein